jgi:hypothetical protein
VLFRRYADDSIVCFERKDDAEAYLRALPERLAKFGLQLAEEKSALVKFNRWEGETSGKERPVGSLPSIATNHRETAGPCSTKPDQCCMKQSIK